MDKQQTKYRYIFDAHYPLNIFRCDEETDEYEEYVGDGNWISIDRYDPVLYGDGYTDIEEDSEYIKELFERYDEL